MGIPTLNIKITRSIRFIVSLIDILDYIKDVAMITLTHLWHRSSHNPPQEPPFPHEEHRPILSPTYSILATDGSTRTLVDVRIDILTSIIKQRVPVLEFRTYLEKSRSMASDGESNPICVVCLSRFEMGDEIRELCNCPHVFHRRCLDFWLAESQLTCPVCRAPLFSTNWDNFRDCRKETDAANYTEINSVS